MTRNASGTFTVIYMPTGRRGDESYEHGITANNRAVLKRKANRLRPNGYHIYAIIWQSGGSFYIWERGRARPSSSAGTTNTASWPSRSDARMRAATTRSPHAKNEFIANLRRELLARV